MYSNENQHNYDILGMKGDMAKSTSTRHMYSDVLICVLHHGTVASGVDKCDLCHFHLNGTCRRGQRCTYAHNWAERLEWICPICTNDGEIDCDTKWQHYKYKRIGVYSVADGRIVAEFLETT